LKWPVTAPGRRADRYVDEHQGTTYREAVHAVLSADKDLATAYAAPAPRRAARPATPADTRVQPAIPMDADVEREIKDWITRALDAGMAGSLPGALGQLAIEADGLRKIGMPIGEAAQRAMDTSPSLVAMARLLLVDIRRNAPENVPTGEDKPTAQQAQGNPAGYEVHVRAERLMQRHPHMDYREAVGATLAEDPALKQRYAGVQS
jgi:hypothetical protein